MTQPAGDRGRRIRIERLTVTRDEWNKPVQSWTEVATVWASWRRATANERLSSGQVGAQVTDIFEGLWSPAVAEVDPKDRLHYAGRLYDVIEATEVGTRESILIRASAIVDTQKVA